MPIGAKVVTEEDRLRRGELSDATVGLLRQRWTERVTPRTGLIDWDQMSAELVVDHDMWLDQSDL
jgi:hypothetical protein